MPPSGIQGHRIVQDPSPPQGILVPSLVALAATRPDRLLPHEFRNRWYQHQRQHQHQPPTTSLAILAPASARDCRADNPPDGAMGLVYVASSKSEQLVWNARMKEIKNTKAAEEVKAAKAAKAMKAIDAAKATAPEKAMKAIDAKSTVPEKKAIDAKSTVPARSRRQAWLATGCLKEVHEG